MSLAKTAPAPRAKPHSAAGEARPKALPEETSHAAPVVLDARQKGLLAEALREGEKTRNTIEAALIEYGRWLLVRVFDNDASAALAERKSNPVWLNLVARAGGPTLRLSERMLYVTLNIAAHDKRIQDDSWRLLEPGRKELLLPLKDEGQLRSAAQHVVSMKLSQRATRTYVRSLLDAQGKPSTLRMSPKRATSTVERWASSLGDARYRKRLRGELDKLGQGERKRVRGELQAMVRSLRELLEGL